VGILGTAGVGISLDSISKLISRGRNWLRLSIGWGRSVSWDWSWSICWCWGRHNDGLFMNKDRCWSWGNNNWSSDKRKRTEGCRGKTDHWGSSNNYWSMSMCMSMASRSISNDCSHQARKNNEDLKSIKIFDIKLKFLLGIFKFLNFLHFLYF
jgi:hypothetical protein